MARPPSGGRWTDRYGPRRNPVTGRQETHHGLDINAAAGTLLVAPADSVLLSYGPVPGWEAHGRVARLLDIDGWEHWLSHTDRLTGDRRVGDRLREGDPIAYQGLTGQTSGMHVHWETRHNGARLDPESWLARSASTDHRPFTPNQGVTDMAFMFLFNGVSIPEQYYIGTYEGLTFSCRPTYNPEARAILALPLPRVQITDAELVELARQGGYTAS